MLEARTIDEVFAGELKHGLTLDGVSGVRKPPQPRRSPMDEAIRPLRPATVKADERHYILDMNPADAPIPQDSARSG